MLQAGEPNLLEFGCSLPAPLVRRRLTGAERQIYRLDRAVLARVCVKHGHIRQDLIGCRVLVDEQVSGGAIARFSRLFGAETSHWTDSGDGGIVIYVVDEYVDFAVGV